MHLEKLRKQIFDLRRRGYPSWKIEVRVTRGAYVELQRELHKEVPGLPSYETVNGSPIYIIDGVLNTSYAIVPFMGAETSIIPGSDKPRIEIVDADRRILDTCIVRMKDVLVEFEPTTLWHHKNARVDVTGVVKSMEQIAL